MNRVSPEDLPNSRSERRLVLQLPENYQPPSPIISERRGSSRFWQKLKYFASGFLLGAGLITGAWVASKQIEGTQIESSSNMTLFNQRDSIWAIGNPHWYWRATCGPTSIAMIINHFEKDAVVTPSTIDREFAEKGIRKNPTDPTVFRSGPNGPYDALAWLQDKGYEWKQIQDQTFPSNQNKKEFNFSEAKKAIDEGYKLIISGTVNWVDVAPEGTEHMMVVLDVDQLTQTLTIADPWGGIVRRVKLNNDYFKDGKLNYSYAVKKLPNRS